MRHPQHDSIRRGSREYFSPCAPRGRASRAAAAPRKVEVGRVEPEPARQVLGRDVVLPCVCFRVTRHIVRAHSVRTRCSLRVTVSRVLNYFIHSVESLERNVQRQPEGRKRPNRNTSLQSRDRTPAVSIVKTHMKLTYVLPSSFVQFD